MGMRNRIVLSECFIKAACLEEDFGQMLSNNDEVINLQHYCKLLDSLFIITSYLQCYTKIYLGLKGAWPKFRRFDEFLYGPIDITGFQKRLAKTVMCPCIVRFNFKALAVMVNGLCYFTDFAQRIRYTKVGDVIIFCDFYRMSEKLKVVTPVSLLNVS